jgi:uncharacterized protein
VAPVRVIYRKYDGSLHWHMEQGRLGSDEYGTWLGAPPGSPAQRGDEPPVISERAQVMLIPGGDARWTLSCYDAGAWTELYIDITTPPRWTAADQVEMVDMDLDVVRRFDGTAEILDEDEFAEHQVKYGYPAAEIEACERAAAWLLSAVRAYSEPFGEVCRGWLSRL